MKKQFLSASVIALTVLAVSCSKNETMQEIPGGESSNVEQISFRSSTGNTRANDFGLTDLESGFNVVGIDKAGAYVTGFANPVGDAQTYHKTAGAWGWKVAPSASDKLWPTDNALYPLTFFMAYPSTEDITKDATSADITVASNMTADPLFAYNTVYKGVDVALDANVVSKDELAAMANVISKPASGFANLSFKHIMSNIAFDVKVPAGAKAIIQSIKIANVNSNGRSYDYKTQAWGAEPTYAAAHHAHYAHFVAATAGDLQSITSAKPTVNGFSDGTTGFNTLKLMPQTVVAPWALGADENEANSFKKDAKAWADASWRDATLDAARDAAVAAAAADPSDTALAAAAAAAIAAADAKANADAFKAWHEGATTANGMVDSEGWKGARIEVIYCLVDETNGKNLVGRFAGVDGATETQLIRVGYALDLENLETKAAAAPAPAVMGLAAGYKYKFTIALGTADATNGVLLDPEYKSETGGTTDKPVDNPKVTPGDPVTKEGLINFTVAVDAWLDYAGDIK